MYTARSVFLSYQMSWYERGLVRTRYYIRIHLFQTIYIANISIITITIGIITVIFVVFRLRNDGIDIICLLSIESCGCGIVGRTVFETCTTCLVLHKNVYSINNVILNLGVPLVPKIRVGNVISEQVAGGVAHVVR